MDKKMRLKFIIWNYVAFLVSILLAGVILLTLGKNNPMLQKLVVIPCSWAPTFVVMVGIKKWKLGVTRKELIKSLFKQKVRVSRLIPIVIAQVLILVVSIAIIAINKTHASRLVMTSTTAIIISFINSVLTGATGEEICWRGILHPEMVNNYGIIKGSIWLGVIWGFWHAPLWFLTSGYQGIDLIKYIVCFLVFIIAMAVIIGISYEKNRNLLVPMILHFTVNFSLSFYMEDILDIIFYIAILYTALAVIDVYIYTRKRIVRN